MIHDFTQGRLDEIKAFATENGLSESFTKTFTRLETYSLNGCDVNLYSDFAPLSFYIEIIREGRFVLNGGFIFHSSVDGFGNGGAPSFSVNLEPDYKPGWSIHT